MGKLVMRFVLLSAAAALLAVTPVASSSHSADVDSDCTYDGIELWGEVEVVDSFGDIKVEVVDSFADLKVEVVDSFADECGEWEMVDSFGDFTVEFVDSFGDITIEYVDSFPGLD